MDTITRTKRMYVQRDPNKHGNTTSVHPLVKQVVDNILKRVTFNVEHDLDFQAGANPWQTCELLGVEHDTMKHEEYRNPVSDQQDDADDQTLSEVQARVDGRDNSAAHKKSYNRHRNHYFG